MCALMVIWGGGGEGKEEEEEEVVVVLSSPAMSDSCHSAGWVVGGWRETKIDLFQRSVSNEGPRSRLPFLDSTERGRSSPLASRCFVAPACRRPHLCRLSFLPFITCCSLLTKDDDEQQTYSASAMWYAHRRGTTHHHPPRCRRQRLFP